AWTRSILTSVPLLAAVVYFIVLALRPSSFNGLLLIDLWVLAYAHVAATFVRVWDVSLSKEQKRFIALDLVLAAFILSGTLALGGGAIWLSSVYLYWQWFHYVRQGYGLAKLVD